MKKYISIIASAIIFCVTFAGCTASYAFQDSYIEGTNSINKPYENILPENNQDSQEGTENNSGNTEPQPENPQKPETPEIQLPNILQKDQLICANVQNLNIRSNPSNFATVVGQLDKGDLIAYVAKENDWYKTIYKQKTAYISSNSNYTRLIKFDKASDKIEAIIEVGKTLLGYPYVWGSQRYHWGNGILNNDFVQGEYDCSAMMQYMFYKGAKINLQMTSREQSLQGTKINASAVQRGDLMFFTNSSRYYLNGVERVGHVGIYLGDNYILHTASDYAVIEQISSTRWSYFMHATRLA